MAGREDKVMVRINGEVKEKFSTYCDEYGMTMSAMAAFLIGQWVRQHEQVQVPMVEALKAKMVELAETEAKTMKEQLESSKPS